MSESSSAANLIEKTPRRPYDLADHFLTCAKLGRYLTVASGSRFVITDDLRLHTMHHEAAAVAAIFFNMVPDTTRWHQIQQSEAILETAGMTAPIRTSFSF